jgi:hypothetical protein
MKLSLFLIVPAIAWLIAPLAAAGQQGVGAEWGQKARPGPVAVFASVMVAQVDQSRTVASNGTRAIGTCFPINYNWSGKAKASLSPNAVAAEYFYRYENKTIELPPITSAELVVPPKHGEVIYILEKDGLSHPKYIPDLNYIGDDKLTFNVNVDGAIVKVVMLIKVTDKGADTEGLRESICKKTGNFWKISQDAGISEKRGQVKKKGT